MNAYSEDLRKKIVEGRGCELSYLPPYSPHLNPIEGAFARLKGQPAGAAARTREALVEAMFAAVHAATASDAHGFIGGCGYRTPAQPL